MAQLDPEDPKVRLAMFGKQVEHFLDTGIGRYLIERASKQSEAAVESLKQVDPTDMKAVMKAQLEVRVADSIIVWLGDAVADGQQATEILKQEDQGV